ncbi:MAG TPA: coproporphyrinogen III oxidase, partial [Woeseiaceae bacterium]|nr:coproporphyrinogen III oxidase [Woeseiaceae bacterium]
AQQDGTLQRNFQGYSTHGGCDLVGLGVSAIGSIGNIFAQNTTSTIEYETILHDGRLPIQKGLEVDDDDLVRGDVIRQLMCFDRLDFAEFGATHAIEFGDYFAPELASLAPLAEDGLVDISDEGIRVTPRGRLLLRSIAMSFDRHLSSGVTDGRFSKAI